MTTRTRFFVITFDSANTGITEMTRTFSTIRAARRMARHISSFATNVRIMEGGPGGMEVK